MTKGNLTSPAYSDGMAECHLGDTRKVLDQLEPESVDCVVTSPPYWGLRDYGHRDQLGLEATPAEYVENLVGVFRQIRRVLKPSGTVWLNLGDSFNNRTKVRSTWHQPALNDFADESWADSAANGGVRTSVTDSGLKEKDLIGIPWRVALALQQPYYTGAIRDERDRIWLAAMLDAEGCLFIHKRKTGQHNGQGYHRTHDSYSPGVEIANTSLAVIERIMALVGKGSVSTQGPDQTGGRRKQTIYRWNLRTTECREFVRELYPHLVAKQQQARILIGCPSSGERAEAAHGALMALHRTGASDVGFPAPTSMYEPGWYLRSDIIWKKPNPMPESVTDRPTRSHEYVFLLTKSGRYHYDADAIREAATDTGRDKRRNGRTGGYGVTTESLPPGSNPHTLARLDYTQRGRNKRDVWTIATQPYAGAHFATFPGALAEPCILAGCKVQGTVLDPFAGSGTTLAVAKRLDRRSIGIEVKPDYIDLIRDRLSGIHTQIQLAV